MHHCLLARGLVVVIPCAWSWHVMFGPFTGAWPRECTIPATTGVAMEVPERVAYPPFAKVERTLAPTANQSTLVPRLVKEAQLLSQPSAATVSTLVWLIHAGKVKSVLLLALPAAIHVHTP